MLRLHAQTDHQIRALSLREKRTDHLEDGKAGLELLWYVQQRGRALAM